MVCMIRAHEVQKEGWKPHRFQDESRPVPMCITIFSAPNYCGSYENKGAFLTISDMKPHYPPNCHFSHPNVSQLGWTDAPYDIPGHRNIIETTMPLVAEAVLGFFLAIMEVFQDEVEDDDNDNDEEEDPEEKEAEAVFDANVEALGRKVASLRVERQEILDFITPIQNRVVAKSADEAFQEVKKLDEKTDVKRF